MLIRPLIASPSPRDIPEFSQGQSTIPCDKLVVKYHHARRAYKIMQSYFIEHTEYTHLILHPDDLIANQSHYDALKKNIEENDYPVLSGVCNVDTRARRRYLLACAIKSFPSLKRNIQSYDFVPISDRIKGSVKVLWAGFPFMWIRRDVLEKIEFEDDTPFNQQQPNMGWGFDTIFCHNCILLGIPIYADFNVFMTHYKGDHKISGHEIKTGIEKPKVLLIKDNQEQNIIEECNNKYLTKEDWKPLPHLNSTLHRLQMI